MSASCSSPPTSTFARCSFNRFLLSRAFCSRLFFSAAAIILAKPARFNSSKYFSYFRSTIATLFSISTVIIATLAMFMISFSTNCIINPSCGLNITSAVSACNAASFSRICAARASSSCSLRCLACRANSSCCSRAFRSRSACACLCCAAAASAASCCRLCSASFACFACCASRTRWRASSSFRCFSAASCFACSAFFVSSSCEDVSAGGGDPAGVKENPSCRSPFAGVELNDDPVKLKAEAGLGVAVGADTVGSGTEASG